MNPIFYIKNNEEAVCYDQDNVNEILTIQPIKKISPNNLIIWTICNGYLLFDPEYIIIVNRKDVQFNEKILKIAQFAYNSEKLGDLGIISLIGRKNFDDILYAKTEDINLDCFLVPNRLCKNIKSLYSASIFVSEFTTLDDLFKDHNNFELSSIQ